MGIKETILSFMKEQAYRPMDIQELSQVFDIQRDEYKAFKKCIKSMEREGLIIRNKNDKLGVPERMGLITGKLQVHQKGFGFLIPDEEGRQDVFIPSSNMNGALNGDRVVAKILKEDVGAKKCEGEIREVIERANRTFVGVYEDSKNFGFVVPEDKRIQNDVFISRKDRNGAETGDLVIVEIVKWADQRRNPEGVVTEVLGKKGEKGLDILTIIKKYGLPEEFPDKVLNYVEGIEEEISDKDLKGRKDLRNIKW